MVDIRTRPPRNFVQFVGQLVPSFNHQQSPKVCGARHHGQFHPESLPGHAGVGGWVVSDILSCHIFLCLKMWYTHQNKGKWWLTSGVGGTPFSDKPTCCHMFFAKLYSWRVSFGLHTDNLISIVNSAKDMKDEQRFYGYFKRYFKRYFMVFQYQGFSDTSPKIRKKTLQK